MLPHVKPVLSLSHLSHPTSHTAPWWAFSCADSPSPHPFLSMLSQGFGNSFNNHAAGSVAQRPKDMSMDTTVSIFYYNIVEFNLKASFYWFPFDYSTSMGHAASIAIWKWVVEVLPPCVQLIARLWDSILHCFPLLPLYGTIYSFMFQPWSHGLGVTSWNIISPTPDLWYLWGISDVNSEVA